MSESFTVASLDSHKICECVQDYDTIAAAHKEESALPRTTVGAAAAQQHSRAPSEIARTELAGSLSSRSSVSQGSDCRWVTPLAVLLFYLQLELALIMLAIHRGQDLVI